MPSFFSRVWECRMQQEKHILPVGATVQDPAGDRYVVESLLGQGGLGAVYLVRDRRCAQNLFALKEIIDPNKHDRARFTFEGEVLKRLNHKALPCVYRVFAQGKPQRMRTSPSKVKRARSCLFGSM